MEAWYWLQDLVGREYALALVSFVALALFFGMVYQSLLARFAALAERSATKVDDILVRLLRAVRPPFYLFLALYIPLQFVPLHATLRTIINTILIVWVVYLLGRIGEIVIEYAIKWRFGGDMEKSEARAALSTLNTLSRIALWVFAGVLVLSNLGVNVSSLIAGLGIGGVAVALAAQNILGDLFSSFAIYFDKPFVVGDFIIVGDKMGVVQKIGIKTTRIRALQGEEIVIANKELTAEKIQNFKRMRERRIVFSFGITYDTPSEKLRAIPAQVAEIIKTASPHARTDRVHFQKFGDSALIFEAVYYLASADYNEYMDTQQSINLALKEAFEKEGIQFAYPTQTVYLAKE